MILFLMVLFESSVNSYDSQTSEECIKYALMFESSVNSYDSQTYLNIIISTSMFESSVNSYDSQTVVLGSNTSYGLRVV